MDGAMKTVSSNADTKIYVKHHLETGATFIIPYRTKELRARCPKEWKTKVNDPPLAALYFDSNSISIGSLPAESKDRTLPWHVPVASSVEEYSKRMK